MILELNADGIIRDADTGEHYGHVPQSLRALYGSADELLDALSDCLAIVESEYNDDPDPSELVSWKRTIAKAKTAIADATGRGNRCQNSGRAMRTYTRIVKGDRCLEKTVASLAQWSAWFSVMPLPFDQYEVSVRDENADRLNELVDSVI